MINRRLVSHKLRTIAAALEDVSKETFDDISFSDYIQFQDERVQEITGHLMKELECVTAAQLWMSQNYPNGAGMKDLTRMKKVLNSAINSLKNEFGEPDSDFIEARHPITESILQDLKTIGFSEGSNYNGN